MGRHIEDVEQEPATAENWAKVLLAFEIIYFTSVALPKMAIVFLYMRIFQWRGFTRAIAIVLQVVIASTSVVFMIAALLQCQPISDWWIDGIRGDTCFDIQTFFHAQTIPTIVLDLVIMALPVRTIWGLRLTTYKRIALLFVFIVASL